MDRNDRIPLGLREDPASSSQGYNNYMISSLSRVWAMVDLDQWFSPQGRYSKDPKNSTQ
jgi:hypothetical protein